MKSNRSTHSAFDGTGQLPLFLALTLFACLVGLIFAFFRKTGAFSLAFGDSLMIEAIVLFGLAWVGYLKKDGIRFFPPRKFSGASAPESWKDRIPSLGEVPSPPHTIPGNKGPDSAEYQRLALAENELRKKILGMDQDEKKLTEASAKSAGTSPDFTRSAALSGLLLLILALCFEYLFPLLSR